MGEKLSDEVGRASTLEIADQPAAWAQVVGLWAERIAALETQLAERSQVDVAAALYTFAAWLTVREERLTVGRDCDASPMAELVNDFCKWNGVRDPDMATNRYYHPGAQTGEERDDG